MVASAVGSLELTHETLSAEVSPELSSLLDYLYDDGRPTIVVELLPLEAHPHTQLPTTPGIVFRNIAFDALLAEPLQVSRFLAWLDTLPLTATNARIEKLGTFLDRVWSRKRIRGRGTLTAIFCQEDHDPQGEMPIGPDALVAEYVPEQLTGPRSETQEQEVRERWGDQVEEQAESQNFTRLVEDAPIGMCINSRSGHPVYLNKKYLEFLGMSRAAYYEAAETGIAWQAVIHDDDQQAVDRFWSSAVESKTPVQFEFRTKLAPCSSLSSSGLSPTTVRWMEVVTKPHCDERGEILYMYSWLVDISSRKLTESLIQTRLDDALETKRRSENFIDMVSHEMRNPLSSILQLADNVLLSLPLAAEEGSILTADSRSALVDTAKTITLCASHQKNIIDEVLTLSKLDSKLLTLAPESVQPIAIVESVLQMVKAELENADIHGSIVLEQSYTDLAVGEVLLDPKRLSQVLLNLTTNAIKFTRGSSRRQISISLAASQRRPTADDSHVTLIEPRAHELDEKALTNDQHVLDEDVFLSFSVQDTGCGLAQDEMDTLFHRFSQASPKTYAQYGGSGLGLFISRELTELQGGQIGVHSVLSEGSTFAFYVKGARVGLLPSVAEPEAYSTLDTNEPSTVDMSLPSTIMSTTTSKENPLTAGNLHVLIVEDNAINQKVMAQQLRKLGCASVHVADHGLDALNILSTTTQFATAAVASNQVLVSVVLLDVEMPVMDGLTCARRIRSLEQLHIPIIGITANARTDQIAACIDAGMDEVVTKPFRIPEVLSRMLALVDKHEQ